MPVVTIGNADRVLTDLDYRNRCVDRLIEIVFDIDDYRGSKRLFIPCRLTNNSNMIPIFCNLIVIISLKKLIPQPLSVKLNNYMLFVFGLCQDFVYKNE